MTKSKRFGRQLLQLTDGLIGSVTDLTLILIYFALASPGRKTAYDFDKLAEESNQFIDTVNYKAIKHALYSLTQSGKIQRSSTNKYTSFTLTQNGKKRIAQLCTTYKEKRPWNHHIHLISYDIPVNANSKRALLRTMLLHHGCGLLQASLWITPYDPHEIIHEFIATRDPGGTILISKLGTNGAIGDETVHELIKRVYRLDELADRYLTFIDTYSQHKSPASTSGAVIDYYAILKDDPQLPFELLPKNFPCKKAYSLYQRILKK